MLDIKNVHGDTHRKVVLEPGDEDDNRKAATALADAAEVVIYTGSAHLIQAFAASFKARPSAGLFVQVNSLPADALLLHPAVHGGVMKKFAVLGLVTLLSIFSFSASACPRGTHPTGGTGSHHKGGTCS